MSTFIKLPRNLDDVPEEAAVPGDREYDLEVVSVSEPYEKEDSGNTVIPLALRVIDPDYPNAKLVNHWLVIPGESSAPETQEMMLRGLKRFAHCFNLNWDDEIDPETMLHATGKCVLKEDTWEGDKLNKLQLPRIRE